jgi:quercetin dioxygenase-like cupin family protein
MAIAHLISGESVDVRPLGAGLNGAQTIALFKSDDLEVMRLVLPKGKGMASHSVQGDLTLQCLEGEIEVSVDGKSSVLKGGHLMYLSGRVPHALTAVVDASALLTIALRK